MVIRLAVWTQYRSVIDKWTDRRTDRRTEKTAITISPSAYRRKSFFSFQCA